MDTHLDTNVAAALDPIGGLLAVGEFPSTPAGNGAQLGFLEGHGEVVRVGIKGTCSYGTILARFLREACVEVVEVDRPNRQSRQRTGKSDPADAIEAARAALSGRAQGYGKTKDGNVEAIRALLVAKRSCRSTKIKTLNQIRHLGFTGPEVLRARLRGVSRRDLGALAASLRPRAGSDPVLFATKTAISLLGHRVLALDARRSGSTPCSARSSRRPPPRCSRSSASASTTRRREPPGEPEELLGPLRHGQLRPLRVEPAAPVHLDALLPEEPLGVGSTGEGLECRRPRGS